jgi:serine/threonine-protein kinase
MSESFSPFKSDSQTTTAIIGNRYELLELIGQGAMSKVYKGRDSSLGRMVAIKFLREEFGNNPNFVARFNREARAVASLPGEHLVSIYDYGQHNATYFIVMEYVEGQNLKEMLRQEGPFQPQRVIELVTPVLLALKAAHLQGIIHRDVKPQNILVRRSDGAVKLTDFGVAYAHDNAQVTSTGMVIGTVDYMAPEQARGEPVGPPADLYAVGIVIFELLAAHLPYTGENTMQVIMGHISKPIPSLASHGISVPPALERLLQRALAKEVQNRFQSAQEMLNAFEMVLHRPDPPIFNAATTLNDPAPLQPGPAWTSQPTAVNPVIPRSNNSPPTPSEPAGYRPERPAYAGLSTGPGQLQPDFSRPTPAANRRNPARAVSQRIPPAVAPARSKKSRLWLIGLLIGLLMLVVIGGLLFYLLEGKTPPAQGNLPTATGQPATGAASAGVKATTAAATTGAVNPTTAAAVVTTAPPVVPVSVKFTAAQLEGAYDRTDHTLFGRTEKALYGAGSDYNQATINFKLDLAPAGKPVLQLSGLDDERAAHCNFEVLVNGVSIFNGPNAFPNVPNTDTGVGGGDRYWATMTLPVPASALKAGSNTIILRNTTPWNGSLGIPYILINTVSLKG